MANRYKNLIYSTAEYTRMYKGFSGIELSGGSSISSDSRLSYSKNMYKDYDGDGAEVIESIPGFRCFAHHKKSIHALYYQRSPSGGEDHIIAHVENKLIRHPVSDIYVKNAQGTVIATVENTKSFGFEYGRYFYVMDTKRILQIDDDGVCRTIGEGGSHPYVPTTYVSGEVFEQRNLLNRGFKEEFYIMDPGAYFYSTKGLKFTITDPNLCYCAVSGIENTEDEEIYLPAYVNIAGVSHKVTSIEPEAFSGNTAITAVYVPEGVMTIGASAFSGCTSLITVVTPSTLTHIGDSAFSGCARLKILYLGSGITFIGRSALSGCSALTTVNYALGPEELAEIDVNGELSTRSVNYRTRYEAIKIALPFHDDVEGISTVKVNDCEVEYDATDDGISFLEVIITLPSLRDATGIKVVVEGLLQPLGQDWSADMTTLSDASPYQAIIGCRIAEVFDGRIFFSGNPDFPNTVFYTERQKPGKDSALYVGRYNYFNDGVGSHKVKSLLAVRDMLAVFKEGDDGSGSIFYHKKEGVTLGSIDTIYPVAYVHSGICTIGGALSFLDDPVFLTDEGLMALNRENINYQRNVVYRSHNVNYALLKENLSKASLCEWLGYLVVGIDGKVFLADSRAIFSHPAGSREYEWFLLEDIGAYTGDSAVYRYSPDAYADAIVHPTLVGETADSSAVYSQADDKGEIYYYVPLDGKKYRVVPTEEKSGGEFFPATAFISHGKRLFFATEDGHICVFNNDMRGVAPESVKSSDEYDEDVYLASMGNRLHPLFYSFADHAPSYVVRTSFDDCGIPHLTKNTVKKSLVIKAKSPVGGAIDCEVATDTGEPKYIGSLPIGGSGFDDFDFDQPPWQISDYSSYVLPEKEKKWIEKQITLKSDDFASPISLYSVSYRYVIKGKIKNNV